MNSLPSDKPHISVQQAAKILGVAIETLRRWDSTGVLVAQRTAGNQRRYSMKQLTEFQKKPRRFPTASSRAAAAPATTTSAPVTSLKSHSFDGIPQGQLTQDSPFKLPDPPASVQASPPVPPVRSDPPVPVAAPFFSSVPPVAAEPQEKSFVDTLDHINTYQSGLQPRRESFFTRARAINSSIHILGVFLGLIAVIGLFAVLMEVRDLRVSLSETSERDTRSVLAESSTRPNFIFGVNSNSFFRGEVELLASVSARSTLTVDELSTLAGGVVTNNADVDAGEGNVFASNLLYGVVAGEGIEISNGQTPTITNTGVSSFQGSTGAVTLTAGSGISISGTTISSTVSVPSASNSFANIAVSGEDTITAGSSTDTLTLIAGSGVVLTTDATGKSVTIDSNSSQWATTGSDIYYNSGNVGIGTNTPGSALDVNGTATVTSLAIGGDTISELVGTGLQVNGTSLETVLGTTVSLNSEVTGTLAVGNGGTGTATQFTQGSIVFAGAAGVYTEDNTGLFYDDTTNRLGLGTVAPLTTLDVNGSASVSGSLTFNANAVISATKKQNITFGSPETGAIIFSGFNNCSALETNATGVLTCGVDDGGGGGGGISTIQEDGSTVVAAATILDFEGDDFTVTEPIGGKGSIVIDYATSNITRSDQNETISGSWTFSNQLTLAADTVTDITGTGLQISGGALQTTLGTSVDLGTEVTSVLGLANGGTGKNLTPVLGGIVYTDADSFEVLAAGNSGQVLQSTGAGAPVWVDASGVGTNYWQRNSTSLAPLTISDSLILGGINNSTAHYFEVNGKKTGKALVVLNETGNQDIFTASAAGSTRFTIGNNGTLTTSYGTGILHSNASGVLSSAAVNLASGDVTGILGVANGGTGVNGSSAGNGTLLIGNGSGYSLATLSEGEGIDISNGSGTITIAGEDASDTNKGIASFNSSTFTALGGAVSITNNSIGDTQLAFDTGQNLTTASSPTFTGLTLTSLTVSGLADFNGDVAIADTNIALDGASTTLTSTGALTLTPGSTMILGATGQAATLQGSTLSLTSNGLGNDISLVSADDISFDDLQLSSPITLTASATSFTSGDTGIVDAINAAYAAATGGGGGGGVWTLSSGKVYPSSISNQVGIGTTTSGNIESSFYVTRNLSSGALGKALAIFNQTENQDIFSASASGTTVFNVTRAGTVRMLESSGGTFYGTLSVGDLAADKTYVLPNFTGSSADICLTTGNCAGAGGGITGSGTATQLAFFTGSGSIGSDSSLYFDSTNKLLGVGSTSPVSQLDVTRPIANGATGKALAIFNQVENQHILTASAAGTTVFNLTRAGVLEASDLTLGFNDGNATLTTYDTNEALTIDPNGTGAINFHSTSNNLDSNGNLTLAGDVILSSGNFFGLGASAGRIEVTDAGTDEIEIQTANLDLNSNLITNIGDANTDFTSGGGLTLAGALDANGQVDLGDGGDAITLSGTTLSFTSNSAGNDITFVSADDISFDDLQLSSPITLTASATSFTSGDTGIVDAINAAYAAAGGGGGGVWTLSSGKLYPTTISNQVGIGTTTVGNIPSSLYVTRNLASGALGKALAILDQTENQDIFTASAAGVTQFTIANNGNVTAAGDLRLNGNDISDSAGTNRIGLGATTTLTNTGLTLSGTTALTASSLTNITSAASVDWAGLTSLTFSADNATINGSDANNGNLTLQGTSSSTRTTSGLFLQPNGGNVGIGTTSPGAEFYVTRPLSFGANGKALVIFDQYENQDILTASASGTTMLTLDRTGNLTLAGDLRLNGNDIADSAGTNRIGLGATTTLTNTTTTLSGTTTVTASSLATFTTAATLGMASTTTLNLGSNATINGGTAANDDLTLQGTSNGTRTTSYVLLQPIAGNVGIGNTAPGAALDVAGNILVNGGGSITTRAAGTLTIGGATQTGLTLGYSGASTSIAGTTIGLTSNGSGNDISLVSADDISFDDLQLVSPVTLTDVDTALPNSNTGIIDAINDAYNAATGLGGGAWTLSSNKIYPTSINHQVGIGTTTGSNIESSFYVTRNLASGALGKALAIFNQTENQDILTASASGTTAFTVTRAGLMNAADLTLGMNDSSATISTFDTNEAITIDPNGSGAINFHSGSNNIDSSGNLTLAGDVILSTGNYVGLSGAGRLEFTDATPDEIDVQSANIDLNTNLLTNIGDSNTDFTSGGGLTLAGTLDSNGNASFADTDIAFDGASTTFTTTGAFTVTPGGAMILGATTQAATLRGTTLSLASNNSGNDITLSSADDISFDDLQLVSPVTLTDVDTALPNSNTGIIDAINDAYNAAVGSAGGVWTLSSGKVYPTTISNQVGIGTTTGANVVSSFYLTRNLTSGALGKSLAIFDQTENQDIFTASASGTTRFVINNAGNVGIGNTAPAQALDVTGNVDIRGTNFDANTAPPALDINGAVLRLGDGLSSQTFTNGIGIKFNDTGTAHASIKYLSSSNRLDFCASNGDTNSLACTSSAETLSIGLPNNGTGNVGIGTTTPGQKLEVNGNISNGGTSGNWIGFQANNSLVWDSSFGPFLNTSANTVINLDSNNDDANTRYFAIARNGNTSTGGTELFRFTEAGNLGIGTSAPGGSLHVTRPLALGANGKALAIFDQIENQDILTASKSGATKFLIDANGNVGIGVGAASAGLHLDSTNGFRQSSNGTFSVDAANAVGGRFRIETNGNVGFGTTAPAAELFVTRPLAYAANGKALAIFDQIENQDILTASAAGTARFTLTRAGGIKLGTSEGTLGDCLLSGGSNAAAVWGACGDSLYWNLASGAYSPDYASTVDLLMGGSASSSAKFAVLNMNSGTPVASVSATGVAGRPGLSLGGDGVLQSLNMGTLTIGGSTTGNILVNPRNGTAGGFLGPAVNDTFDLGSDALRWRDLYLGGETLHIGTSTSDEYTIGYDTTNNRLGFNVNGSGNAEFIMDSSGNLGIGTTAPGGTLEVNGVARFGSTFTTAVASTDGLVLGTDAVDEGLEFVNSTSSSGYGFKLYGIDQGAGVTSLRIANRANSGTFSNIVSFEGTSGNVGIGTTAPEEKLHINTGNFKVTASNDQAVGYIIGNRSGDNNGTFQGTLALAWHSSNAAVDNSFFGKLGRIAFGGNHTNTSASNILYAATIEGVAEGTFSNSTTMPTGLAFFTGSTGAAADVVNQSIGTERMRIAAGGNVGIGVSSPTTAKLEVAGLGLFNSATYPTDTNSLCIGDCQYGLNSASSVVRLLNTINNSGAIAFRTQTGGVYSDKMYIKNDGNVGIGTTAPSAKFAVSGTGYFSGDVSVASMSAIPGTAQDMNLAPNPDFEVNVAGGTVDNWTVSLDNGDGSSTVTRAIDDRSSGAYSIKSVRTGTTSYGFITSSKINIKASASYTLGVDVKGNCAGGFYARVEWADQWGNSAGSSDTYSSAATTASWATYTGSVTAPANAYSAQIRIFNWQGAACTRWFDNVTFRQTSFDGGINFAINTGNVGIGTTTASSKLTVSGTVESTTGGFKMPDGTTLTTAAGIPVGSIIAMARATAPTSYLIADGSSVSRSTYSDLFSALVTSKGTVTVTLASPGVFTLTSHGLHVGDAVYLTTTGALPTGLSANTTYYVASVLTANTFTLSSTRGGAAINTSVSQSGTHTLWFAPYGVPDANNFYLPDLRGRTPVGQKTDLNNGAASITIASPAVFTYVSHALAVGDPITIATTGSLPTGLSAGTTYYVQSVTSADTFTVAATVGGAAINTSGSQSGVHTVTKLSAYQALGQTGGEERHTLSDAEMPIHNHTFNDYYQTTFASVTQSRGTTGAAPPPAITSLGESGTTTPNSTANAGSDGAHSVLDPYQVVNWMIKATKESGADVAEVYYTKEGGIGPGMIMSMDPSIKAGVKKSTKAYDPQVMGVVPTQPGLILSDDTNSGTPVMLALVGRVPVLVSTINGPIREGDAIVPSNIPGVGMRATKPGYIVGKAMGSYDNPDPKAVGTVMLFVKETWFDPDVYLTETGDLNIFADTTEPMVEKYSVKNGTETVERKGIFSDLFAAKVNAGIIETSDIRIGGRSVKEFLDSLNGASASGSGMLSASESGILKQVQDDLQSAQSNILSNRIAIDEVKSQVASMSGKFATLEQLTESTNGLLEQLLNSPTLSASESGIMNSELGSVNSLTVGDTLQVLGHTTLSDLGVTGNITAGILAINGLEGSINSIGEPLKLQSLKASGVDILDGKVTIDTSGNITTEGEITVKKVNIDETDVAGKSIGGVTIPAGELYIDVPTAALTTKSRIFVTPERPAAVGGRRLNTTKLRIELETALPNDLKVNWWIVN